MKLAIMQPYFFPYLGYFQLMRAADTFVFYDDVTFIKGGWINRNSILSLNGPVRITLQVQGASSNRLINEVGVGANRPALLKTITQAYAKAPFRDEVMPLVERCLSYEDDHLAPFLHNSLMETAQFIGLKPTFLVSSELEHTPGLAAQDRVLDMCGRLGASHYINPVGGKALYDKATFKAAGLDLSFLECEPKPYPQFKRTPEFVPYLSILDALMFLGPDGLEDHLAAYSLS